jgi:molybdopterin-guanine dinucleotide biosynthesis protein A
MFDAVILAGGGRQELLTEKEGVLNKAFISLNSKPLLSYVLQALAEAPSIDRIVVIGPVKELESLRNQGPSFEIVAERAGMLENVAAGLHVVDQDRLCLVVTGDIPLLTTEMIENFLQLCAPYDHDLYYPILESQVFRLHYPETERTYVRLKEGQITGGNLGLVNPAWFFNSFDQLELFISYRKKPLKLLRILPPVLIFKYLLRSLSVRDLELSISRLLHFRARAVNCEHAEIGIDVDKISDLELVREVMQK